MDTSKRVPNERSVSYKTLSFFMSLISLYIKILKCDDKVLLIHEIKLIVGPFKNFV